MFESSSSKPHLILLAGDEGVLCVPYNMPAAPMPFLARVGDNQGGAAILAIAAKYPRAPVTLLADTLSQDLRRDLIPRLNPFDRAKLIRRRLQQAFPQARLAAHLDVKSDRTQVVLAGLHSGAIFEWLGRIAKPRPGNPPRIGLLPVECAGIISKLMPQAADGWGLLLSRQRTGGFRQIVTHRGEIIFTRLTPSLPPDATAAEIADTVARDIQASRGYLGRLGLGDGTPLHAALLMPEFLHDAFRKIALPVQGPFLLSPHEAARNLGLPFAPGASDAYGDLFFAAWIARKKRLQLALMPSDLRQARRTISISRWGMRAALAMLALALGMTAWNAGDLATTLLARQKESAQLIGLKEKLKQEQADAEPVTEPLGRLRQALERQRLFAASEAAPWPALQALGEGLGTDARLEKLDWQDDSGKPADETLRLDVKLTDATNLSDRETTVAHFQKLAQSFSRAMPDYTVEIARYPFPALPQEALSNSAPDGKNVTDDATAEFSIRRIAP